MRIFPKNITKQVWQDHLDIYCQTLVHHKDVVYKILSDKHQHVALNNIYICPICLENYFVITVDGIQGNAEFSLDHVPPKAVGGKHKLITCKKCNNDSGAFESELEKTLNFAVDKNDPEAFHIPDIKVNDINTGIFIKGNLKSKDNKTEITFGEKIKKFNPKYVEFLSDLKNKKRVRLDIPLFNRSKIEKSLLKSSYLICFIWWGYEFVFSKNGELLRKAIKGEIPYPVRVPISWLPDKDNVPTQVCLLEDESKRLAFLVNIELKGIDAQTTACVVIPNPTPNGWNMLNEVQSLIKTDQHGLSFSTLPMVVHRFGYTISWNIILD